MSVHWHGYDIWICFCLWNICITYCILFVYILYLSIHGGFVVTHGGIKRCWFPCLKSEMTNPFDNVFELAWLSDFAGHSWRRLLFTPIYISQKRAFRLFFQMEEPSTDWHKRVVSVGGLHRIKQPSVGDSKGFNSLNEKLEFSFTLVNHYCLFKPTIVHSQYIWLNEVETNQPSLILLGSSHQSVSTSLDLTEVDG